MTEQTNNLDYLQSFINEMKESSSGNYKIETIKKHSDSEFLQKIFNYTYNPYKKYNVTSKNCKKNSGLFKYNLYNDLFDLLDDLANRVITGHDAIAAVNGFITGNTKYEDLIFNIIDRDLKMGASTSSINKVIPGCIPTFKVALANPYNPKRQIL
jgi:hypothetical protein